MDFYLVGRFVTGGTSPGLVGRNIERGGVLTFGQGSGFVRMTAPAADFSRRNIVRDFRDIFMAKNTRGTAMHRLFEFIYIKGIRGRCIGMAG